MRAFRLIPRCEVKSGFLIKGIRMEGLAKYGDLIEKVRDYFQDGADEIMYSNIVASLYLRRIDFPTIEKTLSAIDIAKSLGGASTTESR